MKMIQVSLRNIELLDREKFLVDMCFKKRVLHLGATGAPSTKAMIDSGRFLHVRLQRVAESLVGMDIDDETIMWLQTEYGIKNIRRGNIEVIEDYPDEVFDIVVAGEILEHLCNPGRALDALRFKLGRDSILIVTVPNAYAVKGFLRAAVGHEYIHPDHVLHHSLHTLQELLRRHGFTVEKSFFFVNGGSGAIADAANLLISFFPRLAEGIGVVCRVTDHLNVPNSSPASTVQRVMD